MFVGLWCKSADLLSTAEMMYVRATHCLQSSSEPVLAADEATDAVGSFLCQKCS